MRSGRIYIVVFLLLLILILSVCFEEGKKDSGGDLFKSESTKSKEKIERDKVKELKRIADAVDKDSGS